MDLSVVFKNRAQLFSAGAQIPTIATRIPTVLKPKYTLTVLKAIDTSRNLRMGSWVLSNPQIQKSFTAVKVKQEQAAISKAVDPYEGLLALETQKTTDLSNWLSRLSTDVQTLQKGTTEGLVKEAQLGVTTKEYIDLLAKPPVSGDIDIKQLLIYGGIAVVGIIALSFLIKR